MKGARAMRSGDVRRSTQSKQTRDEGAKRSTPIWRSYVLILPTDYDIILVVIVADAELPQPHYDSTLPFKEESALILLSVTDALA